jgi:uncharacterized membrane protein YjjP (DUF1212 family)
MRDPTQPPRQFSGDPKPRRPWLPFLVAAVLGALIAVLAELPWQLVLYSAVFAPGLWMCALVCRHGKIFDIGVFVGLFLIVAGMLLDLVAETL